MGTMSWWDSAGGFSSPEPVCNPRLTVRCEYPDTSSPPSEVTFRLSPSYGLRTTLEAHEWFLAMLRNCEEFEVETDVPGEWPVPVCSETVRRVMVE